MKTPAGVLPTAKKTYGTKTSNDRSVGVRTGHLTLVKITTSSRGILNCLSAFPRTTSDRPLEYALAVSKVLIPLSNLSA